MRAGGQIQLLERTVEIVDDADVVAVDEHLRVLWRTLIRTPPYAYPGTALT